MTKAQPLIVYLPDSRGVEISRYGFGNLKLGLGVFTYSRIAGGDNRFGSDGTCPGATDECEAICYAKRIGGPTREVYARNSRTCDVPPIPDECKILRIHISGDFDSVAYIDNWITRLTERPDVTCWAYTRSWRVAELVPALERLRALPNVQLFASLDPSCQELPPAGWRRAWIWREQPKNQWPKESRLKFHQGRNFSEHNAVACDGTPGYVCPEETGRKPDCLRCGYCFEGQKHDVVFLEH